NGKLYNISYKKGYRNSPFKEVGKTDKTFTEIKFTLDDDIFDENNYSFEEISEIAKEQASLLPDGKITVTDVTNNKKEVFQYENGIQEFLEKGLLKMDTISSISSFSKEVSHYIEKEDLIDDIKIEMVFAYTKQDEGKTMIEILNGSNLIHHGTIYEGLLSGFRSSIHKYARDNNLYKKNEKQVSRDDIMVGLNYIVNFKSYFPVYSNQTKFASEVRYYRSIMQEAVQEFFES